MKTYLLPFLCGGVAMLMFTGCYYPEYDETGNNWRLYYDSPRYRYDGYLYDEPYYDYFDYHIRHHDHHDEMRKPDHDEQHESREHEHHEGGWHEQHQEGHPGSHHGRD